MQIGLIGLGIIGRNLALNFSDNGVAVIAWDRDSRSRAACPSPVGVAAALPEAIARLDRPRRVLLCVPAGAALDDLGAQLAPLLHPGDLVIDGGNSHYRDTIDRARRFRQHGIEWIGLGISGGEEGARHGAALMVGATAALLKELEPVLTAAAAKADGHPCLALLHGDGAGHFVKTAHNGIEYALMQTLAEIYLALRHGFNLSGDNIRKQFAGWAAGPLSSYLADLTVRIMDGKSPDAGLPMLDSIRDRAEQKGTGAWAAIAGMELGTAIPTIAAAVGARIVSTMPRESGIRSNGSGTVVADQTEIARIWGKAAECAFPAAYAQGFDLIAAGAKAFNWTIDPVALARSWRGGCIVRSAMLKSVSESLAAAPAGRSILLTRPLRKSIADGLPSLRIAVRALAEFGLPAPTLAATLAYIDALFGAPLGANLIALQRDQFGRHGVERMPTSDGRKA